MKGGGRAKTLPPLCVIINISETKLELFGKNWFITESCRK
jgi:hypothetical protein